MKNLQILVLTLIAVSIPFILSASLEIRCPKDLDLGINPTAIPRPNIDDVQVRTNCRDRNVIVKHVEDDWGRDGCTIMIRRIYSASNRCGEQDRCEQIIVFVYDTMPPIIPCDQTIDLGCNPNLDDIPEPDPDNVWPRDECDVQRAEHKGDKLKKDGCKRTLTRTYCKIDRNGTLVECKKIWCWIEDKKEPKFVKCPKDVFLGCNPDLTGGLPPPTEKDYKNLKVVDDCEYTTTYIDAFSPIIEGCTLTLARKWIATDICGNTAECFQLFSWIADTQNPVITNCPEDLFLGCLTEHPDIDDSDQVVATDACGKVTVTRGIVHILIDPITCWVDMSIAYNAEDPCGNVSQCTQIVNYKILNNPPPVPAIPFPPDITICGPIPPPPNYDTIDACGVGYPVLIASSIQNGPCNDGDGCIVTRTWIRRSCGTIAEIQDQTITVDCNITFGDNLSINRFRRNLSELSVSPNPGKNVVMVSWPQNLEHAGVIELLDLSGRVIQTEKVQNSHSTNSLQLNVDAIQPGIYLIRMSSNNSRAIKKWIKQ